MKNYITLLKQVLEYGVDRQDRTDVGSSRFINGAFMQWNLSEGFPIITCRKVSPRIAFEETMMFLRGETDTTVLEDKGINIWKGNTTREFLDSQGLNDLPVGSLGKGYSHQWRNFGGQLDGTGGVDQISQLLEGIKKDPTSRRHIVSAWNPCQLRETPLPPCHIMHMYTVDTTNNKLNSGFVMRSNDLYHGTPFNIMGYAFLNIAFSKLLGYEPGTLTYFAWDAHIYKHQLESAETLVTRDPKPLPTLNITKDINTLDDLLLLEFSDLRLDGYDPHPPLAKINMAV